MSLKDFLTLPGASGNYNKDNPTEAERRALHIEQVRAGVELAIERKSVLSHLFKRPTITGTSTLATYGVGGGGLEKLGLNQSPEGKKFIVGKSTVSIDTPVISRTVVPELDLIQTHLNIRNIIKEEQANLLAKFVDETYIIAGIKAAMNTTTPITGLSAAEGFHGGTSIQLTNQQMAEDPASLMAAIDDLETAMAEKDVDTGDEDTIIITNPKYFKILRQDEKLINKQIILSDGTSRNLKHLELYDMPIFRSNNFVGGRNVQNHLMSNASNSNAYDGDFTKVVALAISKKALVDGQAYSVKVDEEQNFGTKSLWLDIWLAFAVGTARPEYAGIITFR